MCLICFENESEIVNLPCGHGGLCKKCGIEIFDTNKECVLCRATIKKMLIINNKEKKN
jgi:hypothetical protein